MSLPPSSIIPTVIEKVFDRIAEDFERNNHKELTSCDLEELYTLFGSTLFGALSILDCKVITSYKSENQKREIVEIPGEIVYKFFPNVNFCPCKAFTLGVLSEKQYTCEHILAAKLAGLLGTIKEEQLTKDQFNYLINNLFDNN